MIAQIALPIEDASQVAELRRRALSMTAAFGFDETERGRIGLAATEAATNILKHAGHGRILLRLLECGAAVGLELLALDKGQGIADIKLSMSDGFSTAGSPGTGLGALQRLSTSFEIYSQPQKGTAIRLEFWPQAVAAVAPATLQWGGVCLPKPREEVAGDNWIVREHASQCLVMVADGLGHGPDAAAASRAAVDIVAARPGLEPLRLINALHGALASTRGAAVGLAVLDTGNGRGMFAGVGNIAAVVDEGDGRGRHLVSFNGIVGHRFAAVREVPFRFPRGALLILHSDGLATHWDLATYPGLRNCHPALIAAVLYREFERGNDDVTVVAVRHRIG